MQTETPNELDPLEQLVERFEPLNTAAINSFEAGIRAATDLQRALAKSLEFHPGQAVVSASADLTRDVGAAYASCARWLLNA